MRRDRLRVAVASLAAAAGTVVLVAAGAVTMAARATESAPAAAGETSSSTPTESPSTTSIENPSDTPTESPSDTPSSPPTGTPTTEPPGEPTTTVQVDAGVLRWGVNNESSNRAYAPDTFNFFSAGKVPDPGQGGSTLPRSRWRATSGDVEIDKWVGSRWRHATWAGLRTDSAGQPLGAPTAGTFSNHTLVFSHGTGSVDLAAGTARVAWHGSATVLYYSGMSFFYVSDPVLKVDDGRGRLTATVSGFASSVDDPESWSPVAPTRVVLADLPDVDLTDQGLSAEPAYRGVRAAGTTQDTTEPSWGAFPPSFVRVMERLGTGAFWYSSGAATDAFKVPLPVNVDWSGGGDGPTPPPVTTTTHPPLTQPSPTPRPPSAALPPPGSDQRQPLEAPVAEAASPEAGLLVLARPATQVSALPATTPVSAQPTGSGSSAAWWVGGVLLLLAAAVLVVPTRPGPRPATGSPRS